MNAKVLELAVRAYPDQDVLGMYGEDTVKALHGRASRNPQSFGDTLAVFVVLEVAEVTTGYEDNEDMALREAHEAIERAIADLEVVKEALATRLDEVGA